MEFKYKDYHKTPKNIVKDYNWENLYEHAHSELTLQQNKRDQIISLYIALFSFMIPFAFSISAFTPLYRGLLFIVLGIIGLIFAPIIVRYRVYKEVYWLSCQTISQLPNYDKNDVNKALIQSLFYNTLIKKSKSFIKIKNNGKCSKLHFFKKNFFSAETFHYIIHCILACLITALGVFFVFDNIILSIIFAGLTFVLLFIWLLASYFNNLLKIYQVAIDGKDKSFNSAFSKAWFLHFYMSE